MKKPKTKFEGWPTTRCYPRTLDEAFPQDRLGEWWVSYKREYPTWNDITLYAMTVFVLGLTVKLFDWML
jgi:hypothetical protein